MRMDMKKIALAWAELQNYSIHCATYQTESLFPMGITRPPTVYAICRQRMTSMNEAG